MSTPNVPVDGAKREPTQQTAQMPNAQQDQKAAAAPQPVQAGMQPKANEQVAQSPANETKNISSPDAAEALSATTPAGESKSGGADQERVNQAKKMAASPEEKAEDETKRLKAEREGEQTDAERLEQSITQANAENDLFKQVAEENKVYADQSREEHRQMRLREDAEKIGDPTRDATAKQAAMDANTPQEGALDEAADMSQGKSDK